MGRRAKRCSLVSHAPRPDSHHHVPSSHCAVASAKLDSECRFGSLCWASSTFAWFTQCDIFYRAEITLFSICLSVTSQRDNISTVYDFSLR